MTPRGLVVFLLAGLCGGGALAQQPEAGLAERPFADGDDGEPIRVVDWQTGEPLPNVLVFALPTDDWPRLLAGMSPAEQRDALAAVARRAGLRVRIDADGRGVVPPRHLPFVLDGEKWAAGNGAVLAPTPEREFVFRIVTHEGQPVGDHRVFGIPSDDQGLVRWRPDARSLAGMRFQVVGAPGSPGMGVLPLGAIVVDLRGPDVGREPIEVRRPPAGRLLLVGRCDGAPEAIGRVVLMYPVPFDGNGGRRFLSGVGTERLVTDLPLGVPIRIAVTEGETRVVTLSGSEPVRVELRVPAPAPQLRYRPVDVGGNALELRGGYGGLATLEHGRIVVRWERRVKRAIVRFQDRHGEEWSCEPIELPAEPWQGLRDEGDLVLTPSSRSLYCSGRVVDEQGQPVATSVSLGDGHAVRAGTLSGVDGRFQLNIGPWMTGPMSLHLWEHAGMVTAPVERGSTDVVVTVSQKVAVDPRGDGQLLGLRDLPVWPRLMLRLCDAGTERAVLQGAVRRSGRFSFSRPAGQYDVAIGYGGRGFGNLVPVVQVDGFELAERHRVEPAPLQLSLPDHLRTCAVRFVGADGRPCPIPGLVAEPTATVQVLVPKRGGREVAFAPILRRVRVVEDCDVVFDPVVVGVEVVGLPAKSSWFFGLSARFAGADGIASVRALRNGCAQLFAPRGATVELRLHAISYDERGVPVPAGHWQRDGLAGFAGRVDVPAEGPLETIRLAAPADLAEQLSALRAPARPQRR